MPPTQVTASLTARVQYMRDSSFLDKNRPSAQRQAAPRREEDLYAECSAYRFDPGGRG